MIRKGNLISFAAPGVFTGRKFGIVEIVFGKRRGKKRDYYVKYESNLGIVHPRNPRKIFDRRKVLQK